LGKIHKHIIEDIEEWPITQFYKNKVDFINELNHFVFEKLKNNKRSKEELIAKSLYFENLRVSNTPWKVDPVDDKTYWKDLTEELNKAQNRSDKEDVLDSIMMRMINRFNQEIVADFKPKTFSFARKFLTSFFKRLFNRFNEGKGNLFWGNRNILASRLNVEGEIEKTRKLFSKGTVVLVPTHFSNLDSIMIGYVLDTVAGLPAFTYGAGLNLYNMELAAHYMSRLGAYRVDRRKKNPIYLECLTSMASYSLYKGLNNIFFPGGTRSRSGAIEDKLKLGLLGSAIEAQRLLIEADKNEKIIVVPVVLGYNFILEAKSLIDQYIRLEAKEFYSRSKDTSITFKDRLSFFKKLFTRKSSMYLAFAEPMDVMGNILDENGESLDKYGKKIDLKDYFRLGNEFGENSQRESVYTKLLSQKILESYLKTNIVTMPHLVSFVAFQIFQKQRKELNVFQLIRLHPNEFDINYEVFESVFNSALEELKILEKEDKIKLDVGIDNGTKEAILLGMKDLAIYHGQRVLYLYKNKIRTRSIKLLYFYHNRTTGYDLENKIDWSPVKRLSYLEKLQEEI
jgi:glycerol-3-phosphate O-acyltransferase